MQLLKHFSAFFLAVLLVSSMLGCASTSKQEGTGEYIDDTVITAKVKTAIFNEPTLKSALYILAWVLTKPLNCTVPLKVSTLIWADFRVGSLKIAAFTLVVMTVSSTYSPVPSCLDVDAQPSMDTNRTAKKKAEKCLSRCMAKFSLRM